MKTERKTAVKYTIDIPNSIGSDKNANRFLTDTIQSLFSLLEKQGQSIPPLMEKRITPEFLEKLLESGREKPQVFSKNKKANAILEHVTRTGGLNGTGEKIRKLGKEFREDFELRHDQ